MTSAVARFVPAKRQQVRASQLLGLAIAAIVPAVLWCVLINLIAISIGGPLSAFTTLIIGLVIAVFLAVVCAPLILKDRS